MEYIFKNKPLIMRRMNYLILARVFASEIQQIWKFKALIDFRFLYWEKDADLSHTSQIKNNDILLWDYE